MYHIMLDADTMWFEYLDQFAVDFYECVWKLNMYNVCFVTYEFKLSVVVVVVAHAVFGQNVRDIVGECCWVSSYHS